MLQPTSGDVLAVMHDVEANLHHRVIGALNGVRQAFPTRRHPQHSPAGSVVQPIALVSPSVENLHPLYAIRLLDAADEFARLERSRISLRRHYHADRRI